MYLREDGQALDDDGDRRRRRVPGSRLVSKLLNLALPPVCSACQTRITGHHALCPKCWSAVDFIQPPLCDRLGIPLPYGDQEPLVSAAVAAKAPLYARARAAGRYAGTLKTLVHDFKFRDRQDLKHLFVRWLYGAGAPFWAEADVLIPVPLHRKRLLARRFNQSALLASALRRATGVSYAPDALLRTRATAQQVGLTASQREDNVRGAFTVPKSEHDRLRNARVVLVDDVITTGATASACTRALLAAGVRHVDVLAVAIAVPGGDDDAVGGLSDAG